MLYVVTVVAHTVSVTAVGRTQRRKRRCLAMLTGLMEKQITSNTARGQAHLQNSQPMKSKNRHELMIALLRISGGSDAGQGTWTGS